MKNHKTIIVSKMIIAGIIERTLKGTQRSEDIPLWMHLKENLSDTLTESLLSFAQELIEDEDRYPRESDSRTELITMFEILFPEEFALVVEAYEYFKTCDQNDDNYVKIFLAA